ncbi:MAG: efflux RND transporter periplasmic adaptor subunit [Acidobacteria bacterium]|nr:efflux RND transporter periplasmic adaptor subunit [Acidobacteriota bacterium]
MKREHGTHGIHGIHGKAAHLFREFRVFRVLSSSFDYLVFRVLNGRILFIMTIILSSMWSSACSKPQAAESQQAAPAAKVENAVKESELATVKLSAKAEERLGIVTTPVAVEQVAQTRTFAGEIVLPPDRTMSVAAPVSGTLLASGAQPTVGIIVRKGEPIFRLTPLLAPERDLRVQLGRDVINAQTRADAARLRFNRAEQLLRDRAGSEKAVEQAREELHLAENDVKVARERLERYDKAPVSADVAITVMAPRDGMIQKVFVGSGQTVASGAPLFEVANFSTVWIRVPVYVGDLKLIDRRQTARVQMLNEPPGSPSRPARPVNAPPTANPANDTADLYFELGNTDGGLRPGQKMGVTLSERSTEESLVVPWSAVLHDIHGGTWVYENTAPQQYMRRRVEVRRVVNSLAVLARGPAVGSKVVTAGAAEIFGTEFGTGK